MKASVSTARSKFNRFCQSARNCVAFWLLLPIFILAASPISAQELVQNGGFETSDFTDWILSSNTASTYVSPDPLYVHSGAYGAELGPYYSPGFLSQTLATVPGQSYLLSFWLDSPDGLTPNLFLASWNGSSLFDQTNLPALGWTNIQFVVTATSSSTVLQFGYQDDPSNLGLDDVSVTPISGKSLQNGGFETGNFTGWTQTGNTNYTLVSTNSLYVESGIYGARLGPDGTPGFLSQTLATTPGQTYTLSLWLDSPDGLAGNFFLVSWNGTNLFSQTNLPAFGWTNLQFTVTAGGLATMVQFGFQDDKSYLGLDDVSLTAGTPIATRISAGLFHSLFLKSDGSLWAMGTNQDGELGDGSYKSTNLPERIVAGDVTAIAAGESHSLFLKSDGSLWAMGQNQNGELGDSTFNSTNRPEQIVASNVTAIAAGGDYSLFLKSDGSLWAMGFNGDGQLGNGTYISTNRPQRIVSSNVTAIAAGGNYSLFLKGDGSLWAMGDNEKGQLGDGGIESSINVPKKIVGSNVTAIAAGAFHSLFIKSDGSLWAMGYNFYGQLGDGGTESSANVPEEIVSSKVVQIAAGGAHSLFTKSDGSLWAMGNNQQGQLGSGTYNNTNLPEEIVAGTVVAVAAGGVHSLFITSDGSLWAMGDNSYGQLGAGKYNNIDEPLRIFPPSVYFTASPTAGREPLTVQFTTPGTDPEGNPIVNWTWNFGDGSTSTAQNPSHTYSAIGIFHPDLIVTTSNLPPIPGFGPSITVRPANDNFTNRIPLIGVGSGNTLNATLEAGEPNPGASDTLWWSWTAPTSGPASVQTYGSSFNPIIDVYTGSALSNLVCVASNLNNVIHDLSPLNRLGFTATAGTTYQIQISGTPEGPVSLAVQPVALGLISLNNVVTNSDESVSFAGTVNIGNSGTAVPGPLSLEVLAVPGYAATSGSRLYSPLPSPQVLANFYLTNPTTVLPGTSTNVTISAVCPSPIPVVSTSDCTAITNWIYWEVFVTLNEQFDTNWFQNDIDSLLYGVEPSPYTFRYPNCKPYVEAVAFGPNALVNPINPSNPSSGASAYLFDSAVINGPTQVSQNSTTDYYGTASFSDGINSYPVNFTNTFWQASGGFGITNGVFHAGSVTTNTPVTLTVYYSYDSFGYSVTNSTQLAVLVVPSPAPKASFSSFGLLTNRNFTLTLTAGPGSKYVIEAATNLSNAHWIPLATNVTGTNGMLIFTDKSSTNQSQRFYRALEIQ